MKRKFLILNISLVIIFLLTSITVYAYFKLVIDFPKNTLTTNVAPNEILINDWKTLVDNSNDYSDGLEHDYNDSNLISNTRKTLKLTADIDVLSDTTITTDCHINLNGFKLNLNGFKLVIKNVYDGTIAIYDDTKQGKIIDNTLASNSQSLTNEVLIDAPNAAVVIKDEATIIDKTVSLKIKASDEQIRMSAMKFVLSNLMSNGINDFYSTVDSLNAIGNVNLCDLDKANHNDATAFGCVYTKGDLNLIYNYFNYNVKITYTTPNTNKLLDNAGKINGAITTLSTEKLIVNIEYNNVILSKILYVHLVDQANYAKASVEELEQYLQIYYLQDHYEAKSYFVLPKKNSYFNVDYLYTAQPGKATDNSNSETTDLFESLNTKYVVAKFTASVTSFTIKATDSNATEANLTIPITIKSNGVIDDNYMKCLGIIKAMFTGGVIKIKDDTSNSTNYTTQLLKTDVSEYNGIKDITFDLMDNVDGTYEIDKTTVLPDYLLKVASGKKPFLGQSVILNVGFNFIDTKQPAITIKVPIIYVVDEGNDLPVSFGRFAPYFIFFNDNFVKNSNSYTYSSFNIPMFYNQSYPTFSFLVYENVNNQYLEAKNLEFSIYVDIPGIANKKKNINQLTGNDLNEYQKNSKSVVTIEIDPLKIGITDKEYIFVYVPLYKTNENNLQYVLKIDNKDPALSKEIKADSLQKLKENPDFDNFDVSSYKYKSDLIIPGIVRCNPDGSEGFEDPYLYEIVYNQLHKDKKYEANKTFIIYSALSQEFVLDISGASANNGAITSLKGINLLTGVTKLNMKNRDFCAIKKDPNVSDDLINQIGYIAQMKNLKELVLINTNLYDRKAGGIGFPTGTSNNFISQLAKCTRLEILWLNNDTSINTNKNKIFEFRGLEKIPALKEVHVENVDLSITGLMGNIFNGIINNLYGSKGSMNMTVYAILQSRINKVNVYYGGGAIELDENLKKVIEALPSLEYQDKIKKGQSIDIVYSEYAKDKTIFEFSRDFNVNVGTDRYVRYRIDDNNIKFIPNGKAEEATSFTLSFVFKMTIYKKQLIGSKFEPDKEANNGLEPIEFTYEYPVTRY